MNPLQIVNIGKNKQLAERGYHFKSEDGTDMVELHVDEIPDGEILNKINQESRFGGNLSVRKKPEEKPLLAFGHDECIFRQFIFTGSLINVSYFLRIWCGAWKRRVLDL